MNIKLIAAFALCALFIAAPGCTSTRRVRTGPAHIHHRPGSNTRTKIHRHSKLVQAKSPTEMGARPTYKN